MNYRTDIFTYQSYKNFIRDRMKELKQSKRALTLQKAAQRLGIQYTYLSKVLRSEDLHLGESHLFQFAKLLELVGDELDYLLLLREQESTQDSEYKDYLTKKLGVLAARQMVVAENVEHTNFSANEFAYLSNPVAVLFNAALSIEKFRTNPYILCSVFGISRKEADSILKILENNGLVSIDWNQMSVKHLAYSNHFSKDHPLMRSYQTALKVYLNARLIQSPEECKENFTAAFTTSHVAFDAIKAELRQTLRRIQEISMTPQQETLCQLNIDLLKWV